MVRENLKFRAWIFVRTERPGASAVVPAALNLLLLHIYLYMSAMGNLN